MLSWSIKLFFCGVICWGAVASFPADVAITEQALVVSSTEAPTTPQEPEASSTVATSEENVAKSEENVAKSEETVAKSEENVPVLPKIYDMKVDTNITNRFAKSRITSRVKNLDKKAQEATFSVVLPDRAFITGFIMEIDGKSYEAYIQEKEQAKATYDQAVQSGISAGHVAVSARDSNRFTVSVNIEPQSKAVFYLTYEELLQRRNEMYELVINIQPGQPVKNLAVEVSVNETRPLKFVRTPSLRTGNEIAKNDSKLDPQSEITQIDDKTSIVKFAPDIAKQQSFAGELGTDKNNGLAGQFVVQYDVERDPKGGEVLINDGYFVHFFAPTELEALTKQVIFVLDTSGSMDGTRIAQLKEAMNSILSELKPKDLFNIVEFSSIVKVWNVDQVEVQYQLGDDPWGDTAGQKNRSEQVIPPAYSATSENVEKAKQVVGKLNAYGGTDIQSALKVGLQLVKPNEDAKATRQPIIVFLTDGEPTVGEYNTEQITTKITRLNELKTPIFSLSFGDGADRSFLQKISLKNQGFARHIYEGADASLQLQEFYKLISLPLLANVTFKYVSNVTDVTKGRFPILFSGSELVVAGRIDPLVNDFTPPQVSCISITGPIDLIPQVEKPLGSLERHWAYLTIKQILEQRDAADNKTELTKKALDMALKYKFVTDVSSLVVVKPNATKAVNTEDASSSGNNFNNALHFNKIASFSVPQAGFGGGYASPPVYPLSASGGTVNRRISNHGGMKRVYYPLSLSAPALSFGPRPGAPIMGGVNRVYYPLSLSAPALSFGPRPGAPLMGYLTTPFYRPTTEATTVNPTTVLHGLELDMLKDQISWLDSILNQNETLNLSAGTFKLGLSEKIDETPACPQTPNNSTGVCTLLYKCPEVFSLLDSVQKYETYFCPLENEFAGVCCPKK